MTKELGWRRQRADEQLELLRQHWGGLPFRIKLNLYWLAIYDAGYNYGLDAPIKRAILAWLLTLSIAILNRYLHELMPQRLRRCAIVVACEFEQHTSLMQASTLYGHRPR